MEMAKVLGKPLKLSDMPRKQAETQRVNNPHSSAKLSGMIFDLSKKLGDAEMDQLAKIMDEELGSDLQAPMKEVDA